MGWHKYKDGSGWYFRGYNAYTGEYYTDPDAKHLREMKKKKRKKKDDSGYGCLIAVIAFLALAALGAILKGLEAAWGVIAKVYVYLASFLGLNLAAYILFEIFLVGGALIICGIYFRRHK